MTAAQIRTERRAQPVFWAAVVLGLAVLIGLGTWQMQRREWKLGLMERIERRAHDEAISLTLAKDLWRREGDVEYYRVLLVGRFLHDQERHLYTIEQGKAGWRVITPLVTAGDDVVLVDRGYVPEELKDPVARQAGQIADMVELTGLARAPATPNWFTPENDPARNRWFWRDVAGMAAGLPADQAARAAPFMVEAEAAPVPGGWPRGGVTRLVLSNRHLEYALTWYGLAVTLAVTAFVFARSRPQRHVPGA
jgi:surfeit locus 1 family protein